MTDFAGIPARDCSLISFLWRAIGTRNPPECWPTMVDADA